MNHQVVTMTDLRHAIRESDPTPVHFWVRDALARKYDIVLTEPVPVELARILESGSGQN